MSQSKSPKTETTTTTTSGSSDSDDDSDSSSDNNSSSEEEEVLDISAPQNEGPRTYSLPDTAPIAGPTGGQLYRRLMHEGQGKHRRIDEFRFALRMFESTLKTEMDRQSKGGSKTVTRFSWKNDGDVSEDFAVLCDTALGIHDVLSADSRPASKDHLLDMCGFLIGRTGISTDVLSVNTYDTKVKDYLKGGTRYSASTTHTAVTNIEFAPKKQRADKLAAYMNSNEKIRLKCSSKKEREKKVVVVPKVVVPPPPPPPPPPAKVAVKVPLKLARVVPPGVVTATDLEEHRNRLRVILCEGHTIFRASRSAMIEPFVSLARTTKDPELRKAMLHAINTKDALVKSKLEDAKCLPVLQAWLNDSFDRKDRMEGLLILDVVRTFPTMSSDNVALWQSSLGRLVVPSDDVGMAGAVRSTMSHIDAINASYVQGATAVKIPSPSSLLIPLRREEHEGPMPMYQPPSPGPRAPTDMETVILKHRDPRLLLSALTQKRQRE